MEIDKNNIIDSLDSYFSNELSKEEEQSLKNLIIQDSEIKKQSMLLAKMALKIRQRQQVYEQSLYSHQSRKKRYWLYSLAAALLILVIIDLLGKSYMANHLFQDYYTVYTPDTSNRGADTLSQKEKELISAFNEIGLKKSESIKVLKDYSEAVKSDYELSLYDADIHWYLALAYIKDNKLKDAIKECEYIIDNYPDSSYVSSAHTLIGKIKAIPFI